MPLSRSKRPRQPLKRLRRMKLPKNVTYGLVALLAAWQATEFSLEYRALIGALVAGVMGFLSPEAINSLRDDDA